MDQCPGRFVLGYREAAAGRPPRRPKERMKNNWKAYREALDGLIDSMSRAKALAEIAGVDIFDNEWGNLLAAEESLNSAADQADLATRQAYSEHGYVSLTEHGRQKLAELELARR